LNLKCEPEGCVGGGADYDNNGTTFDVVVGDDGELSLRPNVTLTDCRDDNETNFYCDIEGEFFASLFVRLFASNLTISGQGR